MLLNVNVFLYFYTRFNQDAFNRNEKIIQYGERFLKNFVISPLDENLPKRDAFLKELTKTYQKKDAFGVSGAYVSAIQRKNKGDSVIR